MSEGKGSLERKINSLEVGSERKVAHSRWPVIELGMSLGDWISRRKGRDEDLKLG